MEIVLELLLLFVLKVLDNLLSTGKQLLIQRQKPIIAALCVVLSQVIFYKLINEVSETLPFISLPSQAARAPCLP